MEERLAAVEVKLIGLRKNMAYVKENIPNLEQIRQVIMECLTKKEDKDDGRSSTIKIDSREKEKVDLTHSWKKKGELPTFNERTEQKINVKGSGFKCDVGPQQFLKSKKEKIKEESEMINSCKTSVSGLKHEQQRGPEFIFEAGKQEKVEKMSVKDIDSKIAAAETTEEIMVEEVLDLQQKNVEQEDDFEKIGGIDSKIATAVIIEEFMVKEVQDLQWTNTCIKEVGVLMKKQEMGMENGSTNSQIFGQTVGDKNCEDNTSKGSGNKTHSWARKMNKACSWARKTSKTRSWERKVNKTCSWTRKTTKTCSCERKMSNRISPWGCATQKFTKVLQLQELQTAVTKVQVLQFPLIPPPPPKPLDASSNLEDKGFFFTAEHPWL